jgi:hypothetical protein
MLEAEPWGNPSHQPSTQSLGERRDLGPPRFHPTLRFEQNFICNPPDFGFPPNLFLCGDIRAMRQHLRDPRVPLARELGQKPMTNPITRKSRIAVAYILAPLDPAGAQVLLDLCAANVEERPNQTLPSNG